MKGIVHNPFTKVLALLLSLMLLFSVLPVNVFAEDVTEPADNSATEPVNENPQNDTGNGKPTEPSESIDQSENDATEAPTASPEEPTEEPVYPDVQAKVTYYNDNSDEVSAVTNSLSRINVIIPVEVGTSTDDVIAVFGSGSVISAYDDADLDTYRWSNPDYITYEVSGNKCTVDINIEEYLEKEDVTLSDGQYKVIVKAGDVYEASIELDTLAPVVTLGTLPSGWSSSDVTVSFDVDEAFSSAYYSEFGSSDVNKITGNSFTVTESGKYSITVTDLAGNTATVYTDDIKIDKTKPSLSVKGYAVGNGDFTDAPVWTDGESKIFVKVEASDKQSGINSATFKIDGATAAAKDNGDGTYTLTVYDKNGSLKTDIAHTISVSNNAGLSSEEVTTKKLLIDKTAPVIGDIVSVTFEDGNSVQDSVLNLLSFGLYSNNVVTVTVTVSANGGSPVSDIVLYDNGDKVEVKSNLAKDDSGNYTKSFTLNFKNDHSYALSLDVQDEVGHKLGNTAIDDIKVLSVKGINLTEDQHLYDLVVTNSAPTAEIEVSDSGRSYSDGDKTFYDGDIQLDVSVKDDLSGLEAVSLYFDKASKFKTTADGKYDVSSMKAKSPLNLNKIFGSAELSGKMIINTFSYEIDENIESGQYLLLIVAKNYSGNLSQTTYTVYKDRDKPVVLPDENAEAAQWHNKPVEIAFTVAEKPDTDNSGIKTVTVTDAEGKTQDVNDNGSGSYSFMSAQNTTYTIVAEDNLGHIAEAQTIKVSKFDSEKPVIKVTGYSNAVSDKQQWTAENVTVQFAVTDDNTETKDVIVTVVDSDGNTVDNLLNKTTGVYSFTATKQGVYEVTAKDLAGNSSVGTTERVLIDKESPKIAKIVFSTLKEANVKNFGVYKNAALVAEVYVKSVGGANVEEIRLMDNKAAIAGSDVKRDEMTGLYYCTFPVNISAKPYRFSVSARNAAGTSTSADSLSSIEVYAKDEAEKKIEDMSDAFEFVITDTKPVVSADNYSVSGLKSDAENSLLFSGTDGVISVTVSDDLSGIDGASIKAQLDKKDIAEKSSDFNDEEKDTEVNLSYALSGLTTGKHTFTLSAKNLAGNEKSDTLVFYVDNTAPVLGDAEVSADAWTSDPIAVSFKATDFDGTNNVYGGLDESSFEVIGSVTGDKNTAGEAYAVTAVEGEDGVFSFTADLHQDYTVTVKDTFGQESTPFVIDKAKILFDNEKPHITNVLLNGEKELSSPSAVVEITFEIDDISDISNEWLSGKSGDDNALNVTVTSSNGSEVSVNVDYIPESDHYKYSFTSNKNDTYSISVVDAANNQANYSDITTIVDTNLPTIDKVSFKPAETMASKVLKVLTFGLYSNNKILMTVETSDKGPSMGIQSVIAKFDGKKTEPTELLCEADGSDGFVAVATFELLPDVELKAKDIEIVVTDEVGGESHTISAHLNALNYAGKVNVPEDVKLFDDFEIVLNDAETIDEIDAEAKSSDFEFVHSVKIGDDICVNGEGKIIYAINSGIVGIDVKSIKVKLDDDTVTDGVVKDFEDVENKKVTEGKVIYNFDTSKLTSGRHTLSIAGNSLTGANISDSIDFYVDNEAPEVTKVSVAHSLAEKVLRFLTFGIYGNSELELTVEVKDTAPSAGIKEITAIYDSKELDATGEVSANTASTEADVTANRTFKLPISSEAYDPEKLVITVIDHVDNSSNGDTLEEVNDAEKLDQSKVAVNNNFEVVVTDQPVTIGDITIKYQQNTDNLGTAAGTVYASAVTDEDNKPTEENDGTYTVTLTDELAGIDASTVKVSFGLEDALTDVTADSTIEYTYDTALADGKKITAADITYKTATDLPSGKYIFKVEAENNAGNVIDKSVEVYVDNTAPVFVANENGAVFSYSNEENTKWVNEKVDVTFSVTDALDKDYYGGIGSVEVKGITNGETYSLDKEVGRKADTYTFAADLYQTYTVTVKDVFGRTVKATTEEVKYDDEPAVISDVKYNGFATPAEADWQNAEDGVTVSFKLNEYSETAKSVLSGVLKDDVVIEGSANSEFDSYTFTDNGDGTYNCSFVSRFYQSYTITVTDVAANVSTKTTEITLVDTIDPEIESISFAYSESAMQKVLNFVTFGIYSNNDILTTVTLNDKAPSSGIKEITVAYDGNVLEAVEKSVSENTANTSTAVMAYQTYKLPVSGESYDPAKLQISGKDTVDNAISQTLSEIWNNSGTRGKVTIPQSMDKDINIFEIVANGEKPKFGAPSWSGASAIDKEGNVWYLGLKKNNTEGAEVGVEFGVEAPKTKLHSISVMLNENYDVTQYANYVDKNGNTKQLPTEFTNLVTDPNETTSANDEKLTNTEISFNTASIPFDSTNSIVNRASDNKTGGKNILTVKAVANNSMATTTEEYVFYVDDADPVITGFEFDGKPEKLKTEDPTENNGDEGTNGRTDLDFKDGLSYIYFFRNKTNVTVSAEDIGSGVQTITFYTVDVDGTKGEAETKDVDEENLATFTVEAGFKGTVYAFATDLVGNSGNNFNPENTIVENEAIHNASSGYKFNILTETPYTDHLGQPLYSGDVQVEMEVWDTYSGINTITYSFTTYDGTLHEVDLHVDKAGNLSESGDLANLSHTAFNVEEKDKDINLVTRLSTVFTIDSSQTSIYNCNDIKIKLSAVDNAGFPIDGGEKTISIDTTAPKIEITYDPVSPVHEFNGERYFNTDRTATITVKERNFDPDSILNTDNFKALEGSLPSINGTENWSREYQTYTDETIHKATILFHEDGKFDVQLAYTDLAHNHDATVGGSISEKETFYIDQTKPELQVNLTSPASRLNDKYYNQTVTAEITVTEHNFSPDYKIDYNPTVSASSNDPTPSTPQIGSWGGSGDTHTATITFSENGVYSFTLKYTDLADNESNLHTESEFVVDTTAGTIEIKELTTDTIDKHAYENSIRPVISYADSNFDVNNYKYSLTKHSYDMEKMENTEESVNYNPINNPSSTGCTVTYNDFAYAEDVDGVYVLEATATDLAGNELKPASVTFSVNRYGSVFIIEDDATVDVVDKFYTNNAPDIVIKEINVNRVSDQSVSISHNSANVVLDAKTDYMITPTGGGNNWYEYSYDIFAKNFETEGNYTVTVSSVNRFNARVTNRTANTEKSDRNCPVAFVVDKTDPSITISGVIDDKAYKEAMKVVEITCIDDNIDKDSFVLLLDNEIVDLESPAVKIDDNLSGELDIEFTLDADGEQTYHDVEVRINDLAGNGNDDSVKNFVLSATLFTRFIKSTPAIIISSISLALIIGLVIFLILRKRRKSETA